jgi:hypothetical protein
MQEYDPLIDAEDSVRHPGKADALKNLQAVLRADVILSKELQRRMAAVLRNPPGTDIVSRLDELQ